MRAWSKVTVHRPRESRRCAARCSAVAWLPGAGGIDISLCIIPFILLARAAPRGEQARGGGAPHPHGPRARLEGGAPSLEGRHLLAQAASSPRKNIIVLSLSEGSNAEFLGSNFPPTGQVA